MNEEVFFRRPSVAKTWLFSQTMLLVSEIFQTLHEDSLHSLFLFCFFQVLVTSVKVTEARSRSLFAQKMAMGNMYLRKIIGLILNSEKNSRTLAFFRGSAREIFRINFRSI